MTTCEHLDKVGQPPRPEVKGCEDCLAEGRSDWVHLRECLYCGGIRCCDSSPRRHATAHFRATGDPVIRSAQPGEEWRWCYLDEIPG